jgi:hypothetical protein
MVLPIPEALNYLLVLNVEYTVLICVGNGCCCVLKPTALSRHLSTKYKTPIALRRQLDQYVATFPCTYDYNTVVLPSDGSALQPVIPIVDGFQYRVCAFKTRDRGNVRKHANKAYNKKRVPDKDVFQAVRLQL